MAEPDQVALIERVARAMWAAESNERTAAVFPGGRSARVLWSEAEITASTYGLTVTEEERRLWRARAAAALEAAAAPDMADALAPFAEWARIFAAEVSTLHADDDPLHKALLLGPDLAPLTIGDMRRAAAVHAKARGQSEDAT